MTKEVLDKIVHQCMEKSDLSEWEEQFLDSLSEQISKGQELSQKQIKKLNEIDSR